MTDKKELERLRETQDRVKRNAEDMDTAANSKGRYFLDPGKALDERAGQLEIIAPLKSPVMHKSDCAVHNGPALPAGPCDCGASDALRLNLAGFLNAMGFPPMQPWQEAIMRAIIGDGRHPEAVRLLAEGEAAQDGDEDFRELVFPGRAMAALRSIDEFFHWPACAALGDPAAPCDCNAQPIQHERTPLGERVWWKPIQPETWVVPVPDPRIVLQSKLDLALAAFKWDEGKPPPAWMWQCTMHGKPVVVSKREFRMRLGGDNDDVIEAVRARVQVWIDTWRNKPVA